MYENRVRLLAGQCEYSPFKERTQTVSLSLCAYMQTSLLPAKALRHQLTFLWLPKLYFILLSVHAILVKMVSNPKTVFPGMYCLKL